MAESLENFKNRQSLIKQKFIQLGANQIDGGPAASLMQQSYANNFSSEASLKELKKLDIFDLGILLILASTGGFDMIDEEFLQRIPNIQQSCCLIHAVKTVSAKSETRDKQILTLVKVFNRLSENCQDFICLCMQQRFSKNEMKKFQITRVCQAADLRAHPWIQTNTEGDNAADGSIKKKKSQFNLHNDGNVQVILSLKELLNVSSDWLDHKTKGGLGGGGGNASSVQGLNDGAGSVPVDFQSQQIERIIDALSLALPTRGPGGMGGQFQENQSSIQFPDSDIKELSYDLGVDPRLLKFKLQQTFK